MVARQNDKFRVDESPQSTPRTEKRRGNGTTIRSRLLSLRKHNTRECNYTNIAMENFLDEHCLRCGPGFTVEVLKKKIRAKLLPPIRLLRTVDFQYINLEKDDLADAHFMNNVEKNYGKFSEYTYRGRFIIFAKLEIK